MIKQFLMDLNKYNNLNKKDYFKFNFSFLKSYFQADIKDIIQVFDIFNICYVIEKNNITIFI